MEPDLLFLKLSGLTMRRNKASDIVSLAILAGAIRKPQREKRKQEKDRFKEEHMQLGITIPLQKHLKIKTLPYGEGADLFYCWELHMIRLQGKNTLAAVNASNRFAIVLWGMKAP